MEKLKTLIKALMAWMLLHILVIAPLFVFTSSLTIFVIGSIFSTIATIILYLQLLSPPEKT